MADSQEIQWTDVQRVLRGQHTEQVLVAQFTVKIGAVQGGAVNIAAPKSRAADRIRPRREPPHILPRTVPDFLDRNREQGLVGQALARGQVVDIHAPDGTGKTALASQAMQAQLPSAFPGGMAYLSAKHETREDLLQDLFEIFFESDERVKVTENDLRRHMAGTRALITVDDANLLEDGEAQDLAQVLPQCALLIAARKQQIWQGTGISLRGLPRQHAVRLFEQHWGRVTAENQPIVGAICEALGNLPLNIIKAATTASQQQLSLDQVLQQVRSEDEQPDPRVWALGLVANQLSTEERRVLGGLAAAGGPTVGVEALPVITGLPLKEIARHLAVLQARGLVHANSPRFSLDDGLRPSIEQSWTSGEMRARAAEYYLGKASALQRLPRDPDEENVLSALDYYFQNARWQQVVTITRSIDRYLASTGRWGQWRKRLEQALRAAKNLGDQATEAWAQNQLGIIAMGVGETTVAKQLFRSALSIRRALSDRPGAVVTRWNLRVLTLPPPTPWNRLLNKITSILQSGSMWLPVALATLASLAIVALLSTTAVIAGTGPSPTPTSLLLATAITPSRTPSQPTITPTPTTDVSPSVEVWLAAGCDGTFAPGTWLSVQARSSIAGRVAIYLVDPRGDRSAQFEADIQAQELISQARAVPEWEGHWTVKAVLNNGQASDQCSFAVKAPSEPHVEISQTEQATATPTLSVWLTEGCGHAYKPGAHTRLNLRASVSGQVDVYLVDRARGGTLYLFSEMVQSGQLASQSWNVPQQEGAWSLAAVLNGGQAREYCGFTVSPEPTPNPEVHIRLEEDCGYTFPAGETNLTSTVYVQASVDGWVDVYQKGPDGESERIFRQWLVAGGEIGRSWAVPKRAGDWTLEAVLEEGLARGHCGFKVQDSTPPLATVDVELAGGCNQVYEPGSVTGIRLLANEEGTVTTSLYDPAGNLYDEWLTEVEAHQPEGWTWRMPMEQGDWLLKAVLGNDRASDLCRFTIQAPPTPDVDITLVDGCGQEYVSGAATLIRLWASVDGSVDVFLSGPKDPRKYLFTQDVKAYQDVYAPWTVAGGAEGWRLVADLNQGAAEDDCDFRVKQELEVWLETDKGCGEAVYEQGGEIVISFGASVNGYVTVRVSGREKPVFSDRVAGGKTYVRATEADMASGLQRLSADLAGEKVNTVCYFYVRGIATDTPVEITSVPAMITPFPELTLTIVPKGTPTSATATPTLASPTATAPIPTSAPAWTPTPLPARPTRTPPPLTPTPTPG